MLLGWNGLLLSGLADAARYTDNRAALESAEELAQFIVSTITDNQLLPRHITDGERANTYFLEDQVYAAQGLLKLYEINGDEKLVNIANKLVKSSLQHFKVEESPYLKQSLQNDASLVNAVEILDNVTPSDNAVLAGVLWKLYYLYGETAYRDRVQQMLKGVSEQIAGSISYSSHWGRVALENTYPYLQLIIAGIDGEEALGKITSKLIPNLQLALVGDGAPRLPALEGKASDKLMFYVCDETGCKLPVHTLDAALDQIGKELEVLR